MPNILQILSLEIRYFPIGLVTETEKYSCDLGTGNFVEPTAAVNCSFRIFIIITAFTECVFSIHLRGFLVIITSDLFSACSYSLQSGFYFFYSTNSLTANYFSFL